MLLKSNINESTISYTFLAYFYRNFDDFDVIYYTYTKLKEIKMNKKYKSNIGDEDEGEWSAEDVLEREG